MEDRIPRWLQHRHETCCEKGGHRGRQACIIWRWFHHRDVIFRRVDLYMTIFFNARTGVTSHMHITHIDQNAKSVTVCTNLSTTVKIKDNRLYFILFFFHFLFYLFSIFRLSVRASMMSYVIVIYIICHKEHCKRFQNHGIITHINSM